MNCVFFTLLIFTSALHTALCDDSASSEDYVDEYDKREYPYEVMYELKQIGNFSDIDEYAGIYFAEFRLFTRSNLNSYERVTVHTVHTSSYRPTRETVFIVHGWNQNSDAAPILNIKNAILSRFDMNVIIVNWASLSLRPYPDARFSIGDIVTDLTEMIVTLNRNAGQNFGAMFGIGFSLGAHIMGLSGKRVGGRMASIIGLDPAYPLFSTWRTDNRLNVGDAQYVQVLHSNGDLLGIMSPIGDFDVYVNGGRLQPNCNVLDPMCSHAQSTLYMANILNGVTPPIRAFQCNNFNTLIFGFCTPTGLSTPVLQLKPIVRYRGVFWGQVQ